MHHPVPIGSPSWLAPLSKPTSHQQVRQAFREPATAPTAIHLHTLEGKVDQLLVHLAGLSHKVDNIKSSVASLAENKTVVPSAECVDEDSSEEGGSGFSKFYFPNT